MKNILFVIFCFMVLGVSGQVVDTPRIVGKFFGSQSGAGAGFWQISGTFTDESGLYDSQNLKVGDVIFFADAGIGYHLPIISIQSATPPSFTIRVNRTGITQISAVPTGLGAVYEPRPNHAIMPYASGLTNPDQQTYMGYVMELIDQIGGGTTYYPGPGIKFSNDSIKVDTTVARYLLGVGEDYEFADTTGLIRTRDSYGHRWSSRNNRNYYLYNIAKRTGNNFSVVNNLFVKSEAAGPGGSAGLETTYTPTDGLITRLSAVNYGTPSPDASIELNALKGQVIIQGEKANQSAYAYGLAIENPSIDSNEVMVWLYNDITSEHEPVFRNFKTQVINLATPVSYEVPITNGNTDSKLFVTATNTGITASFASNKLTVTIPSGVKLFNSDWHLNGLDVQSSADGSGTTNWILVQFIGIPFNGDITQLVVPNVQKISIPTSGDLSITNAATFDFDNNPAASVVAIDEGTITLRVGGLAVGAQGYNLKFSNF